MMTPEGVITEGSYSNSFLVMKDGSLRTHPANQAILGGITRDMVIRIAKKNGFKVLEQPFTLADIKKAPEAFLTSTTSHILPVVKVGTQRVGSGKPGPQTQKLMRLYQAHVHQQVAVA